ncbi:MAG: HEPN domain-containing protein [Bacteroidota bacterium]
MIITKLNEQIAKEDQEFIDELIPLNIKARYPEDKERIKKILTNRRSKSILKKTEKFYSWIKTLLKQ